MNDPAFLAVYAALSAAPDVFPERFFLPGEDLRRRLQEDAGLCQLSLEHKSRIEDCHGFLIAARPSEAPSKDGRLESPWNIPDTAEKIARRSDRPLVHAPAVCEPADIEGLIQVLGQQLGPASRSTALALVPYRTFDDWKRLAHCLAQAPVSVASACPLMAMRFCVSRAGWSRFVSHLEQIQLLKSAVALSALPVAVTQGRRPRLRISFGPAVSVGWESKVEFFDVLLSQMVAPEEAVAKLRASLPHGYDVLGAARIPTHFPSLEESANWAEYSITEVMEPRFDWHKMTAWFRDISEGRGGPVIVRKEKPGSKVDVINVAEILANAAVVSGEAGYGLKLSLRFGPKKNLKPDKILELGLGLPLEQVQTDLRIRRTALALESAGGKLRYL